MAEPKYIGYCPHCGNTAVQDMKCVTYRMGDKDVRTYVLTQCTTCNDVLFYRAARSASVLAETIGVPFDLQRIPMMWPSPGTLHSAVPESIAKIYREASLIKGRTPSAFANQIRRCLEALCKNRGATGKTLAQNLQELAGRGEIPPTLAEMTDLLRQLGNIGSHADEYEEITPEYVEVIDDFFRAVVEYVYIAPQKVNEFKARLDEAKKAGKTPA